MTRLPARVHCNSMDAQYCSALSMKNFNSNLLFIVMTVCAFASDAQAGSQAAASPRVIDPLDAPSFEMATETAYLLGIIGNPNSYEIGAQFITARWRIATTKSDSWLRGYHQFYFSGVAEPIFRGPENHYFGISMGFRYNFVQPDARLDSVRFRRRRPRLDRQHRYLRSPGSGFHLQHLVRRRCFVQGERPLEGKRGRSLSASFQWRPDGSESESQSARAAGRPHLFVLVRVRNL